MGKYYIEGWISHDTDRESEIKDHQIKKIKARLCNRFISKK